MSIESEINRINQNIQDSLSAVASKGVEVPEGANSDDLPGLINEITFSEEDGGDSVIKYIESMDTENRIPIRSLDSGMYILYGRFIPYEGSTSTFTFSTGMLVSIIKQTSVSYIQIFYSKNNTIQYLEITDESVFRRDAKLIDMESKANMTTIIDENSDDEHYPSAKAVWDLFNSIVNADEVEY